MMKYIIGLIVVFIVAGAALVAHEIKNAEAWEEDE